MFVESTVSCSHGKDGPIAFFVIVVGVVWIVHRGLVVRSNGCIGIIVVLVFHNAFCCS